MSPIPTETFNYIDSDAHLVAAGLGWTFYGGSKGTDVNVEIGYQGTMLQEMPVTKRA